MKKKLLLLFSLFVLCSGAYTQQKTITGTVSSAEDNELLPGVSVYIKGTTTGTTTDINGSYKLPGVSAGNIIVFSFIGFEKLEIPVGENNRIDVKLKSDTRELEGVVVTALGVKRQKREIGFSTDKIEITKIENSGSYGVMNTIMGRSAGVNVTQSDGIEGGSTRVVIRGNTSLKNDGKNQPLIVVDGVPMENISGLTDIGRGVDWGSAINDLNAFDIETMDILKGGQASALYGARGGNGAIIITTKRGYLQKGLGVTYNFEQKFTYPYRYREVQNIYGHGGPISLTPPTFPMSGDTLLYPGIYDNNNLVINQEGETSTSAAEFGYYGSAVSWGPKMEGQMVKWWDGAMRPYSPQPDNLKLPFHTGLTRTHNISATGGSDKGTVRVSITRQDHTPIVENSNYNRTNINLGSNLKISEKLRVDLSLSYFNYRRLNSPMLGESASSFSKGFLYSWPRSYKGLDKQYYQYPDGSQNPMEGYPFYYINRTLWWDYYNNNTNLGRDKYLGSLTLTYSITPWLEAMGRVGRDFSIEQYETKNKPIDVIGLERGYYGNSLQRNIGDNFDFLITASKASFLNSKLDVKLSFGASRWDNNVYGINGHSGIWYYPNMYTFFNYTENTYITDVNGNNIVQTMGNSAGSMVPGEIIERRRIESAYSFIDISYKNYVYLEITGRNDWSSSLPEKNASYFFPSMTLSFIASDALSFQERLPWMNFLKIRGGISQTATDAGYPYLTQFYYNTSQFGGEQISDFPSTIPPIELKPQRINSYEGGFVADVFDSKLSLEFAYYYIYCFDQIINLPLPASSGASSIMINEGVMSNEGIEITLNTVPLKRKNLLLKSGINFSRNRNKIVDLGGYSDTYLLADIWGLNGPAMILHEGDDYGTISGYDYIYDDNGNRVVNEDGTKYLITDTRVPIGNASPDFTAGWTTELTWKGFRISTLVDTKWGGDIYCGSYVIGLQTGQSPETLLEREGGGLPYTDPDGNTSNIGVILEGVHEDGTQNSTVVHYYYKYFAGGWGKFLSTPGIIENTWVKLRDLTVSYTIPQKLVEKSKVFQNLKISLTGRDLFYIYTTLPDKINPEGIMGSGNAQGFEWASFPGTRSLIFGISAGF